ncbi:MAG: zf-HC2 domain-containing protein [Elusimicrobiales bacterium]|nr:zf-HC2 domain-containing protein [Elusimicrobiales bacterium]
MDGELGSSDRSMVERHLAACADCAAQLRRFLAVDTGIKQLPGIAPSPFFTAKVAAAARYVEISRASLRRFLRLPVPAMALLVSFIVLNLFTFAFNINAMENGPRRELTRMVVAQLAKPASLINPVAVARLCGECSKYMCLCMHEAGKKSLCPCKDCEMEKERGEAGGKSGMGNMEGTNVH